ncbi:MAG: hypothetical protein M3Q46_15090, partial [Verrucomicrobiota bacterium]|nr:hypothetical protein [Verrucomicrobiota bacterium]
MMFRRAIALFLAVFVAASAQAAQVNWGASETNSVALSTGTLLPVGNLVRVGSFSITDAEIIANKTNFSFLTSKFTEFGHAAVGDNVGGLAGLWFANTTASSNALGIANKRIYYFLYNVPSGSTPTQIGIYT